jgi:hypothetical protein
VAEPSLADVRAFGSPIYVPSTLPWWVAGVEHSNGVTDAVLVFGDDGMIEIRTESVTRMRQPLSIRVQNVQRASAPQRSMTSAWQRVLVTEAELPVAVNGTERYVRVLQSATTFSFELEADEVVVRAAGSLTKLESLSIARLDNLALSG